MTNLIARCSRENLLAAGSSGVMLAFAHVHPDLWFIALFALVPFLWRLWSARRKEACPLGVVLATTYVLTTSFGDFVAAPWTVLIKLAALSIAFAAFAYAISRAKSLVGLNPLAIAVLWVPFGYVLTQYVGIGDIFFVEQIGSNLVAGFGSLVGVLLCSAVIILGNSLLLLFARYAKQRLVCNTRIKPDSDDCFVILSNIIFTFETRRYCLPVRRAPPRF